MAPDSTFLNRLRPLRWQLRHAVRIVMSGVGAYLVVHLIGLQVDFSAVVTAIIVTQSNVGGSYRMAVEQVFAAVFGAVCGAGAALLIAPHDWLSIASALALALIPLAFIGARSPSFRMAPISAVIILLNGPGLAFDTLSLAIDRVIGVALGSLVGIVVSLAIFPARAFSVSLETSASVTSLLAQQMLSLRTTDIQESGEYVQRAARLRRALVSLSGIVEEHGFERKGRGMRAQVPDRLLRTLRRLRLDVDLLRRAARQGGNERLPDDFSHAWDNACWNAGRSLEAIAADLSGDHAPDRLDGFQDAVRSYLDLLQAMQRDGRLNTLDAGVLRHVYGIGYALEQMRRNIHDLATVSVQAHNRATIS